MKSLLHPRRRARLRLTLLAILALLFQQVALASYVCSSADIAASGHAAMGAHCTGMPMARVKHAPVLCAWHCDQVTPSTQNAQTPSVPPLALPALLPASPTLTFALPSAHVAHAHDALWRSRGIPPALRFRVLLI